MKVLLVTKTGKNYGAVLQAVALSQAMSELGVNVRVLQWPYQKLTESYSVFKKRFGIHEAFYNFCAFLHALPLKKSSKRFLDFRKNYLTFTQPFDSEEDVYNGKFDDDIMVVGSDQVWNPNIRYSPIYFLDFGNEASKRVSYAASIGLSDIPDQYVADFQRFLAKFYAVSVREDSAQRALKKIGVDSREVVDPTLLYDRDHWSAIASERLYDGEYVLVYSLYKTKLVDDLSKKIKKDLKCKVVVIQPNARKMQCGDTIVYDAGPREFLSYVKYAKFVITTSFHGTMFSINFGVPFVCVSCGQTSSRMTNVLSNYNLSNRMIISESDFGEDLYRISSDYDEKLSVDREESKQYLKNIFSM